MNALATIPLPSRPREKILSNTADISLGEMIATLLGSGVSGLPIHELAMRVEGVLRQKEWTGADLRRIVGIGEARAARIMASKLLWDRLSSLDKPHSILDSPVAIVDQCQDMVSLRQEHLRVFFLDSRSAHIHHTTVSIGIVDRALSHPREVFRPAIVAGSSAIALVHNHPSGDVTPSEGDFRVTTQLIQAGKNLEIAVVDHVIVSSRGFYSFKMAQPALF